MCEFSAKLVYWLDRELPESEALDVQRHVHVCTECQRLAREYEEVSVVFDAYCAAAVNSEISPGASRWLPVFSGAAAVAAVAIALLLIFPRARVESPTVHSPAAMAAPVIASAVPVLPAVGINSTAAQAKVTKIVHRPRAIAPSPLQSTNWQLAQPAIQIAIPAEAMFPPGAVPEGVNFIADVGIAPDGSAQRLRLQPELMRLEGRTAQP